ncbi:stage II sporulation protein R [uncultured Clostridium sp.]|nr:stage II sporulation protein R [uncultured Clostridium sp.]
MKRTCKLSLSSLCFLICFLLSMSGIRARDEALAADIAPKILRFHVLANSDSARDQALKLYIKDLLLEKIRDGAAVKQIAGKEELKAYILSESSTLEADAEDFIHSFGYDYGVRVGIETCRFPVRTYGDMTFPAGMYEAVRVTIGNGAGHNFWCVLYPSLCYTDSIHASMPEGSKETLKSLIPENDYEALLRSGPQRSPSDEESAVKKSEQETVSLPTVKIRFRIAELFS